MPISRAARRERDVSARRPNWPRRSRGRSSRHAAHHFDAVGAIKPWIDDYDLSRPRSGIKGLTPWPRVNNLIGNDTGVADPTPDAWITWNIWQVADPEVADMIEVEEPYRIYRDAGGFDAMVGRTREALKQEGFGVITGIDVQATLKSKIDVNFRPYLILGACNPAMAHEALLIEDQVGTMLPCNVVVQERPDGRIEVAAIGNPALSDKAAEVVAKLRAAIEQM